MTCFGFVTPSTLDMIAVANRTLKRIVSMLTRLIQRTQTVAEETTEYESEYEYEYEYRDAEYEYEYGLDRIAES